MRRLAMILVVTAALLLIPTAAAAHRPHVIKPCPGVIDEYRAQV